LRKKQKHSPNTQRLKHNERNRVYRARKKLVKDSMPTAPVIIEEKKKYSPNTKRLKHNERN